ncbi:MAG: 2,3-diaminopropionate biosynthesis protein SbnA [Bdellovibrionales bacterium]
MSIINSPLDLTPRDEFLFLKGFVPQCNVYMKLEGLQATGSIKVKSAIFILDDLEQRGLAIPGKTTIVESTSGNMGIALSFLCRLRNYRFICVTDPKVASTNKAGIEAYGGEVIIVDKRDKNGDYVGTRVEKVKELLAGNPDYVCTNQYSNPANKKAHATWTAEEILRNFKKVDYMFIGAGTTGTLMGIAESFSKKSPDTKIIAVEPEGSVTFDDTRKGTRLIPGIGASQRPPLTDPSYVDQVIYVEEPDTIKACYRAAQQYGMLFGGSTGSVMAAILSQASVLKEGATVVAVSPDFGDRYMDTIYSPEWVIKNYGFDPRETDYRPKEPLIPPLRDFIAKNKKD